MPLATTKWDMADNIRTPENEAEYLNLAFEDGDPSVIAHTLGAIIRARGVTRIARETGLSRETLYKSFQPDGNPSLETMTRVIHALGLSLRAVAA